MVALIDPDTLDFALPPELIAQEALAQRDKARLLVLNRSTGTITHGIFSDILDVLIPGDVLVLNRARVDRSKVYGRKITGGRVEVIFIEPTENPDQWKALIRPQLKKGTIVQFADGISATLVDRTEIGENILECSRARQLMEAHGVIPLPPYIERKEGDIRTKQDEADYQTVYSSAPGSIAAPTAGLHFTAGLLDQLRKKGILVKEILLNVGWGTFRPISGNLETHRMLEERFDVSALVFKDLIKAKKENRRIIAVGTTVTRALETLALDEPGPYYRGATSIFIKPGYPFKWLSGLITNFHVPRSTPIALTAAFAGLDKIEKAYQDAIEMKYRFFSYGDAMMII